jgi:hypothetical protein
MVIKEFKDKGFKSWQPGEWTDVTSLGVYKPFSELVHTTHVDVAKAVLSDGRISTRPVNDYTQLNGKLAVWLAPGPNGHEVYGPVTIHLNVSMLIGMRCFFVECVDYAKKEMATRFVCVTKDERGDSQISDLQAAGVKLRPYNPFCDDGPWKIDDEGTMSTLTHGQSFGGGDDRNHTTEFVVLCDVPLTEGRLIDITTNMHTQCRKSPRLCPERYSTFSDVLDALQTTSLFEVYGFDFVRFFTRAMKHRFRKNPAEMARTAGLDKFKEFDLPLSPEIEAAAQLFGYRQDGHNYECRTKHFPADIDFVDYGGNEFSKAVCEAVNGSFKNSKFVTSTLIDAIAEGRTVLKPAEWMAVLASFIGHGPVSVQSGMQLESERQAELIGVAPFAINELPRPFLEWWVSHNTASFFY